MSLPNQPSSRQERTYQYVLLGLASVANFFTERSTALVGSSLMVGAFLHQYSRTCAQKYSIIEIPSNYFQPTASRPTTSAQLPPLGCFQCDCFIPPTYSLTVSLDHLQFGCSISTADSLTVFYRPLPVRLFHPNRYPFERNLPITCRPSASPRPLHPDCLTLFPSRVLFFTGAKRSRSICYPKTYPTPLFASTDRIRPSMLFVKFLGLHFRPV